MSARCKDESRLGRDVVSLFPYTTKKAVALGGCGDWATLANGPCCVGVAVFLLLLHAAHKFAKVTGAVWTPVWNSPANPDQGVAV